MIIINQDEIQDGKNAVLASFVSLSKCLVLRPIRDSFQKVMIKGTITLISFVNASNYIGQSTMNAFSKSSPKL